MLLLRKHGLLFFLLLVGLTVRILFMKEQGFSNDELSALCRTRFSGLGELWASGVKVGDMHPAFYQTMLWFWVKIFGENEFLFRVPSLLFYLLNSLLIYRIASKYYLKEAGLLMIALYTGLTFTIINTVFARPYNSGTFFLLLSFLSVLELRNTGSGKWKAAAMLAFGLAGAMLSHYFAFWVAVVLSGSALFYVGKENLKYLIIGGIGANLLFLPHIQITLFQLSVGGLQWLPPPGWMWIPDFIKLFMNESMGVALILFAVFLLLIFFKRTTAVNRETKFSFIVFFSSFLGAVIISYAYTPILRELVMLFMLPFLLLSLFSLIDLKSWKYFAVSCVILSLGLVTDSIFRNKLFEPVHYGVFREIGDQINKADRDLGRENITYASNYNSVDYINYYADIDLKEEVKEWMDQEVIYKMAERANNAATPYFCYSFNNAFHTPMYLEVIRKYYPKAERTYLTKYSSYYLFSKGKERNLGKPFIVAHTSDTGATDLDFFGTFKMRIGDLPKGQGFKNYYLVTCKGKLTEKKPLLIVVSLEREGKMAVNTAGEPLFYSAIDQSRLVEIGKEEQLISAFEMPPFAKEDDEIVIYCWNPEKSLVYTDDLKVYLTK